MKQITLLIIFAILSGNARTQIIEDIICKTQNDQIELGISFFDDPNALLRITEYDPKKETSINVINDNISFDYIEGEDIEIETKRFHNGSQAKISLNDKNHSGFLELSRYKEESFPFKGKLSCLKPTEVKGDGAIDKLECKSSTHKAKFLFERSSQYFEAQKNWHYRAKYRITMIQDFSNGDAFSRSGWTNVEDVRVEFKSDQKYLGSYIEFNFYQDQLNDSTLTIANESYKYECKGVK